MSYAPSTSKSEYSEPSEELLRKKRRSTRMTIVWILLTLIGLTALENHFIQQSTASAANNIAVLAVFNVILILLFVLIVLITRNLIKVYNERKSKILGSKFQTKLIMAFLILALVPSILLFTVASKLFTFTIGSWFNIQIEQTLRQSMDVAQDYYAHLERTAFSRTQKIEGFITQDELFLKEKRDQLKLLVKQKMDEYELGGLILYDDKREAVASRIDKKRAPFAESVDFQDLLLKSVDGEGVSEFRTSSRGNFLVVAKPLTNTVDDKLSIWGYILTLTPIPGSTQHKIQAIQNTFENYKRQKFLKLPVSASYYITFLMITLLILFSAIWLGFYMARGITVPLRQLAEGTRRIAEGDLDFRIGVRARDEIGFLVESFNRMTSELKDSRAKIRSAHKDMQTTNIELQRRRQYIETILENIGAGVISVDKQGRVTTFNKAAENILKVDADNVFGLSYKDALDPSYHEPIRRIIREMNRQRKEHAEEQIELRVEESTLNLLVSIQALRDTGKKYLGLVIVFEDLTQMIKTQKIAAWKEVAQGIAHEIKNPLTPIQLNTQRLRKKYHEDPEGFSEVFDESIDIISQEVEGMKDLLNEFLRFSRMPAPDPKPTSLHKIIDDIYTLYSNQDRDITIKKSYDPNIHLINIDAAPGKIPGTNNIACLGHRLSS
ncbi:MAG: HAMP domain-containing protein [Nitrospinae bacterium]|nr:HAMP domain-containing protein [Nitrospinota bacterium]